MLETRQSQAVVKSSCAIVMSGQALFDVTPRARDSGSQKTEKP
jgi:hypothetical protein